MFRVTAETFDVRMDLEFVVELFGCFRSYFRFVALIVVTYILFKLTNFRANPNVLLSKQKLAIQIGQFNCIHISDNQFPRAGLRATKPHHCKILHLKRLIIIDVILLKLKLRCHLYDANKLHHLMFHNHIMVNKNISE